MRRGRYGVGGFALLAIMAALWAPGAFAAGGGTAVQQGYPCATTPPAAPGAPGGNTGSSNCSTHQVHNVAAASHTVERAAPVAAAPQRAAGVLPFTGVQLGVFVVLGVLLIAGGFVLRASGRTPTAS